MTTEEEFEQFVRSNRDLIERMMALQKGAAAGFVDAEREIARETYGYARGVADAGRARTEELVASFLGTFTDPEVQRHFMNMGMEFIMGMSAIAERAPLPDFAKEGYRSTHDSMMDAACRARDCGKQQRQRPQRVEILESGEQRDPEGVFKSCEE